LKRDLIAPNRFAAMLPLPFVSDPAALCSGRECGFMKDLVSIAQRIAEILKQRHETVAVAESSSGGLIAAALLAIAGASNYFVGGSVTYTRKSMTELLGLGADSFGQMRGLTEPTALVLARGVRDRLGTTWAVSEIGAAGPTGSRYGDAAGTSAIAVVGPVERSAIVQTGNDDRAANMDAFARAALELFEAALKQPR
jgi:nicotinamide-nucleotide amidase